MVQQVALEDCAALPRGKALLWSSLSLSNCSRSRSWDWVSFVPEGQSSSGWCLQTVQLCHVAGVAASLTLAFPAWSDVDNHITRVGFFGLSVRQMGFDCDTWYVSLRRFGSCSFKAIPPTAEGSTR